MKKHLGTFGIVLVLTLIIVCVLGCFKWFVFDFRKDNLDQYYDHEWQVSHNDGGK